MYNLQLTTDELIMLREGVISKSVLAKSKRLVKSQRINKPLLELK